MYFEQKIVNGILCHRGTPDGEWIEYTQEELTGMLQSYHNTMPVLAETLDDVLEYGTAKWIRNKVIQLATIFYNLPY